MQVKPKYLENMKIQLPPSSSSSTRVGTLDRKHTSYDIWNVGDDNDDQPVVGEELKGLSCLLPRKSEKGKLFLGTDRCLFYTETVSEERF